MVYGPAGSGKTGRLVEHAARRYRDDRFAPTLVLVPTARHGDQFRRRLVAESGAALNLDVSTLARYARLYAAGRTLPGEVASELLRRVARERIVSGGAGRFEPIAETPGLHALVSDAVAELVAAGVEPAALTAAAAGAGSADLIALSDIYAAYRRELAARGWRDPAEAPSLAAEAAGGAAGPPGLVLVDSFDFLNPREQSLVAALAARTRVLVAIDREASARARWTASWLEALAPASAVEELRGRQGAAGAGAHRAFDAEAQLRGIARSIKRRLAEEAALRPSDVAVAFRQASQHLALARRVFSEYELPFDPAAGERLSSRPFGIWVLSLLRLPSTTGGSRASPSCCAPPSSTAADGGSRKAPSTTCCASAAGGTCSLVSQGSSGSRRRSPTRRIAPWATAAGSTPAACAPRAGCWGAPPRR